MNGLELFGAKCPRQLEGEEILGIAYDSRKVKPGFVFICIKGYETDGHLYAKAAEEQGAVCIVAEDDVCVSVPVIKCENARFEMAELAVRFYREPSKKFKLIGITGTNGKTTTSYLIKGILEKAGYCVGIIGTNQNSLGTKVLETKTTTPTTPNSLELQQMFSEMAKGGADYVVMEVSSHALELGRVHGCSFEVGVFTNLTQDHLDFHKTMENYMLAKAKLFKMCKKGVINIDDEYGKRICDMAHDVLTVGMDDAILRAKNINITARGTTFDLEYDGHAYKAEVPIPGKFSVYNALSAIGACLSCGIDMDIILDGLKRANGVLGRIEVVHTDTPYTVLIDYAHTPDGLENIISTVKEFTKGRVITLFGCGGDRDATKRPIMGEIAGRLSDFAVLTSDNPRTEDPDSILDMIEDGIKKTDGEYIRITNRREAIGWALRNAGLDDCIILAGKGQETYQIIGKEKINFDERAIVFEELRKI